MKIWLLTPDLSPLGPQSRVPTLAVGLRGCGLDVQLIELDGPFAEARRAGDLDVIGLGRRWPLDPAAFWRLRQLLVRERPDVIHAWQPDVAQYAARAVGRAGPPLVVSQPLPPPDRATLPFSRAVIRRAARFVVDSLRWAEAYRTRGCPAERITIISPGAAISDLPTPTARQELRAELSLPDATRIVGTAGPLVRSQRVGDLVWAMQLLRQITENVHFVIIGGGPQRRDLKRLARHFGCEHLISFLGERPDARRLVSLFDVLWYAGEADPAPDLLLDAMAAAVPIVAADTAAMREQVADGQTGFLVKPGDSVGFAQFTDRILADADLAHRLGSAARQRIQSDFDWQSMVERHADLYRDVVGHGQ